MRRLGSVLLPVPPVLLCFELVSPGSIVGRSLSRHVAVRCVRFFPASAVVLSPGSLAFPTALRSRPSLSSFDMMVDVHSTMTDRRYCRVLKVRLCFTQSAVQCGSTTALMLCGLCDYTYMSSPPMYQIFVIRNTMRSNGSPNYLLSVIQFPYAAIFHI